MREIRDYLIDIKTECEYLISRSKNIDYSDFVRNEELKRAFVRSLEIIGEACKNIPRGIKKNYPHIQWKGIVGMRNILVHEYFGIDFKVFGRLLLRKFLN